MQLDKLLGTIPQHARIALVNDPGVDADAFLYHIADHHLQKGRTVLYVIFNRPSRSILAGMDEFGFNAADSRKRLLFIDAYSALMGQADDVAYTVNEPTDPAKLLEAIARAAKEHPGAIIILDALTTLLDHAPAKTVEAAMPALQQTLEKFPISITLMTRWPYGPEFAKMLDQFDAIINLKGVEDRVVLNQFFVIERANWLKKQERRPLLYKSVKPGGVLVYIPKIVITGPYHAGKTTFIHTLSDTAVSVNRLGTTVALDHGHMTYDGLSVDLFGTPGQERFDPLLKTIAGQALGVIVLVDSTRPDSLDRAREMMELTSRQGLPVIIAANKQDEPGALPPAEISKRLHAPDHVRVVGCTGRNKNSARAVLAELINQIMVKEVAA